MTNFFQYIFHPLNRNDEEFFSLFQKQQAIEKSFSQVFCLVLFVMMNIVKYCKIIIEKIWEHLIIKFKRKFSEFHIYHAI